MDNKLLVFLHGFGFDKDNNKEALQLLADKLQLESYLSLDAPFPSQRARGGFAWFTPYKDAQGEDDKFDISVAYIYAKIEDELKKKNLTWGDVLLCGRSQGACMALYVGLTSPQKCKAVISFCGFFDPKHSYPSPHDVPIIRLEAGRDDVLLSEQKSSYRQHQRDGIHIDYIIDENSNHNTIADTAVDKVFNALEKYL